MKKQIPVEKVNRLVNTGCVVLVTSKYKDKTNIVTLAWQSPLSHNPMLLGVSIANKHLSNELIKESGEFAINIPHRSMIKETQRCGSISGREVDKFRDNNLKMESSNKISTPGIKECIANIECRLEKSFIIGDHTLFVGKVLFAKVEEGSFDFNNNYWKVNPKSELLHHLGSNLYVAPNKLYKS